MDALFFLAIDILDGYKGEYRQQYSHRTDQYPGLNPGPGALVFGFCQHGQ
jgi:hypothetical protein